VFDFVAEALDKKALFVDTPINLPQGGITACMTRDPTAFTSAPLSWPLSPMNTPARCSRQHARLFVGRQYRPDGIPFGAADAKPVRHRLIALTRAADGCGVNRTYSMG